MEHVLVSLGQPLNVAVKQLLLLLLVQLLSQVPPVVLAQLLAGLTPPKLRGAHLFGQKDQDRALHATGADFPPEGKDIFQVYFFFFSLSLSFI